MTQTIFISLACVLSTNKWQQLDKFFTVETRKKYTQKRDEDVLTSL